MSEPNKSILSRVRELLEKTENFEVRFDDEKATEVEMLKRVNPDFLKSSKGMSESVRKKLVEAFFRDMEKAANPRVVLCLITG